MSKLDVSKKDVIIGLRRLQLSKIKIGGLLYQMYSDKIDKLYGVNDISALIHMDPRRLDDHIGFRLYPQGPGEKHILHLSSRDMQIIEKTEKIFKVLLGLPDDEQLLAQYVFLYLVRECE